MSKEKVLSETQKKWASSDQWEREKMLKEIGYSIGYGKTGWSKLPHLCKVNLERVNSRK